MNLYVRRKKNYNLKLLKSIILYSLFKILNFKFIIIKVIQINERVGIAYFQLIVTLMSIKYQNSQK